jgi:hypothetical protein
MQLVRRFSPGACPAWLLVLAVAMLGCGGGGPAKAPVKGKVVAGGQPVAGGKLTFAPGGDVQGAVPIVGQVQPDGTFVMSTDREGDGVAIGTHQVSYSAPDAEVTETTDGSDPIVKLSPYANMVVQQREFEVKAGQNELTIELVPGPPPPSPE